MRARFRFMPLALIGLIGYAAVPGSAARAQVTAIPKWRVDPGNTGWNSKEKVLNRLTVGNGKFGKLWERKVDGQVYAQPLYVAGVNVPVKGVRNVVFVCTEHNSVYAFDADSSPSGSGLPLWQTTMGPPVPTSVVGCYDLSPEYGITATPVIDVAGGVMYLTAKTLENGVQTWRLHALDIHTGSEVPGWGQVITGSVVNTFGTTVTFNPDIQLSRSGLTMANGRVYIAFGSHCDIRITEYRGWIFSYNAANAAEAPQVMCVAMDSNGQREAAAGIWSSGAAPVVDENGDLYVMTGNGLFNLDLGGPNMGDSVVKIKTNGGAGLSFSGNATDYFTPSNQQQLTDVDADLGSGGIINPPAQVGANTPDLILGGGKDAILRVMDRANLGGFNGRINPNAPNNVLQEIGFPNGFWSSPAYYGGDTGHFIYMNAVGDVLRQYKFGIDGGGNIKLAPFATGGPGTGYPSSSAVVSSDAGKLGTGVVWLLNRNDNALHAYDADNIGTQLYSSNAAGTRDTIGNVIKFTVPLVANGRVFVGADGKLISYGAGADLVERTDHFAIVGPTVVNRQQRSIFEICSLTVDGQPSPTMGSASLEVRAPSGLITNIGPIYFNGAADKLFYRIFDAAGTYTFTAAKGTSKQATFSVVVRDYAPDNTVDHFHIVAPTSVAQNLPFGFTLVALDRLGRQVTYSGIVAVKFTKTDGTYLSGPTVSFRGQKTANATATLVDLGDSVMIASDGAHTGTWPLKVREASNIQGKVLPGDWVGHDRLRCTIQLLDPFNHNLVAYTKTVILGDDFSFALEVPSGVYDVAAKIDHWLQQIITRVDTNSGPTLTFNGPDGNGLLNGDTDNNNKVDQSDVDNVTGDLGGPPSGTRGKTDLNGDYKVDATDLAIANKNKGRQGDR